MSQTFSLVCTDKKLKIWVGQGWRKMDVFYSGEPDVMGRLGRFLEATRGHALILICDDEDTCDAENFVEFEGDE